MLQDIGLQDQRLMPRIICRFPPIRRGDLFRVRFINRTPVDIELNQLAYANNSNPVWCPHRLESGSHVDMDVYQKSSWIARNFSNKDNFYINNEKVFKTKLALETFPQAKSSEIGSQRLDLIITVPLRTLQEASILAVKNCLSSVDDADSLGLPKHLIAELKKIVKEKSGHASFS